MKDCATVVVVFFWYFFGTYSVPLLQAMLFTTITYTVLYIVRERFFET